MALLTEEAPALGRIRRLLIEKDHLSKRGKGAGRLARMDAIEREMAEAVAQALAGDAAEFAKHVDATVAAIEAVAEAESAANAALLG